MRTVKEFIDSLSLEERNLIEYMQQAMGDKRIKSYILLDGRVKETDMIVSMIWQQHNRHLIQIGDTKIRKLRISTVFLPVSLRDKFFETMVFGPDRSSVEGKYTTLAEAVRGHSEVVHRIKAESQAS